MDYMATKAYRPIDLLPVVGKTLEKLFTKIISWELFQGNKMSTQLYRFTPY